MNKHIKKLPKKVYDRIAAGEVIDRPSSILRELVDNSIDAGSTEIIIRLSNGGNKAIEVIDNGYGMSEEDIKICCEPFTTSKIDEFEDLLKLDTYGFRGEALNSISTISNVEIVSKTDEEDLATNILIEGGDILSISKSSRRRGTTIFVKNIFFNIPARKKSMKSQYSEYLNCREIVLNKYLPINNISFEFFNNGEKKFNLPANTDLLEKIRIIQDKYYIDNLIKINNEKLSDNSDNIRINGYIGKPDLNRPRRNEQYIFINSRPIYLSSLSRAIMVAYEDTIPKGRFPVVYIFIEVPKDLIDVNVHPAKKEVRLINEREVVSMLINTIRENLTGKIFIENAGKKIDDYSQNPFENKNINNISDINIIQRENNNEDLPYNEIKIKDNEQKEFYLSYDKHNKNLNNSFKIKIKNINFNIYGILFDKYIIAEKEEELILIKITEALKKIKYEEYKNKYSKNNYKQNLMFPILIETNKKDMDMLCNHQDKIKEFGFNFDKFGSNTIAVRVIPEYWDRDIDSNQLKIIFDKIIYDNINSVDKLLDYTIEEKLLINKDKPTNEKDIINILEKLFQYANPFISKTGEPIAVKLSIEDIDYLFKNK